MDIQPDYPRSDAHPASPNDSFAPNHDSQAITAANGYELVNTDDICGWFNINEATVRTWVRKGKFPRPMKMGQLSRWKRSTIVDWIDDREAEADATAANRAAEDENQDLGSDQFDH